MEQADPTQGAVLDSAEAPVWESVEAAHASLRQAGYICDRSVAVLVFLATRLGKPVLLEGPAGVGKTELAKSTAAALGAELVRLQCYEGLDESKALYEWDYSKQLLYSQLIRDSYAGEKVTSLADAVGRVAAEETVFFQRRFLLERPLLRALVSPNRSVLLVDEIDRSDPEFEALLLELLSDFQVTIPELGTLRPRVRPIVFLTSNGSRDLSEALRRRCLYHFVDYPTPSREAEIVRSHVGAAGEALTRQVVELVAELRKLELEKSPSISESVEWTRALVTLGAEHLTAELVRETLSALVKHKADLEVVQRMADKQLRK